jgi:hypothetical protein
MVLLRDAAQVDARFGPFKDSANLDEAQKTIWTDSREHLGDVGHVESHFDPFRDSVSIDAR